MSFSRTALFLGARKQHLSKQITTCFKILLRIHADIYNVNLLLTICVTKI